MKERLVILKSEIAVDQKKLDKLFTKIERAYLSFLQSGEYAKLVEAAFYINQLYTGFERMFKHIAKVFESNIEDDFWHKSLLERMSIEIESVRPAVISKKSFDYLNELRSFRHFFRHAYDTDIDREKFNIVIQKTKLLEKTGRKDLEKFVIFLQNLIKKIEG